MLLTDVSATLVPVLFKHSPIRSCQDRAETDPQDTGDCGTSRQSEGGSGTQWQTCNSEATSVNICCVPRMGICCSKHQS